jgi:two-component system, OmpR family, alkaline phosphatase synthesis response regulator PhoP
MPKKILVVDYEPNSIEDIREILKGESFSLQIANDGQQALQSYMMNVPDLVLTAALLPKLNGFELCRKITGGHLGEVRPVIMYSAIYKAEKYRKEAIFGCGAIDFLEKPIPKWQLMKVIKTAFSEMPVPEQRGEGVLNFSAIPEKSQELPRTNSALQSIPHSNDVLDVDALFEEEKLTAGLNKGATGSTFNSSVPLQGRSNSPLIASIDTAEIDAALDAFRIDLENEVKLREEKRAQEIEEELLLREESILEFEGVQDETLTPGPADTAENTADLFELDGINVDLDALQSQILTQNSTRPPASDGNKAQPKEDEPFSAYGSTKPDIFRYWISFTLLVVVLLFFLLYWSR